jgi:hypothetical protein
MTEESDMSLAEKAKKLAELKARSEQFDPIVECNWWIGVLSRLYVQVEMWLEPLRQEGLVTCSRLQVQLTEEKIGTYPANELVLQFGPEEIILEPIGTLIAGARGRVDVFRLGARSEQIMLILSGAKKEEARWEIWPSRDPRQRKPLDQASFEAALDTLLEV